MKAAGNSNTPHRPDHQIRLLGEAFNHLNQSLNAEDIEESEREQLIGRLIETVDGLALHEAQTKVGRRIKAMVLLLHNARSGGLLHEKLALSIASDCLLLP